MSQDPTPEEIQRVKEYEERRRTEQHRKYAKERDAKIAAHAERITRALIDETITDLSFDGLDEYGEIERSGSIALRFRSGRVLRLSVGGWDEVYLDIEIEEPGT